MPRPLAPRLRDAARVGRAWRRTLLLGLPVGLLQVALRPADRRWHQQVGDLVVLKTILFPRLSCAIGFISAAITHAASNSAPSSS